MCIAIAKTIKMLKYLKLKRKANWPMRDSKKSQ